MDTEFENLKKYADDLSNSLGRVTGYADKLINSFKGLEKTDLDACKAAVKYLELLSDEQKKTENYNKALKEVTETLKNSVIVTNALIDTKKSSIAAGAKQLADTHKTNAANRLATSLIELETFSIKGQIVALTNLKSHIEITNKQISLQNNAVNRAIDSFKRKEFATISMTKVLVDDSAATKMNAEENKKAEQRIDSMANAKLRASSEYKKLCIENAQAAKKETAEQEQFNKVIKIGSMTWKDYADGASTVASKTQSLIDKTLKISTAFGGAGFSLNAIKEATLKYNKSLFDLTRNQSTSGNSMQGLGATFAKIRKETIMSKQEFLDFGNSMSKSFIGVKPSIEEMGNFATLLQSQFGPNLETISAKAQTFLNIQKQYPSMYKDIVDGMKAVSEGRTKDAQAIQQTVLAEQFALDMGQDVMDDTIQATSAVPKPDKELMDLNQKTARAAAESADATVNAGKAMEKECLMVADADLKLNELLAEHIGLLISSIVSTTALGVAI